MSDKDTAIDFELDTPCPNCGDTLVSVRNKDGTLFLGVAKYLVFCKKCDFEEDANKWQKRLDNG